MKNHLHKILDRLAYDPQHQEDDPPLAKDVYLMHVHEQDYVSQ